MKKVHLFFTLDAEESWINTVQAGGYRLSHVTRWLALYTFKPLTQTASFNPYTRIDFRNKAMSPRNYADYRQLFADSGWRLITGSRHGGAQYFQQTTATAAHDIFSDSQSRAQSRQRYLQFSLTFTILFFMYFGVSVHNSTTGWSGLWHVKSWYLTPGIWQMHGGQFWRAMLIETPVAVLRTVPAYVFLILGIFYLIRVIANLPRKLG